MTDSGGKQEQPWRIRARGDGAPLTQQLEVGQLGISRCDGCRLDAGSVIRPSHQKHTSRPHLVFHPDQMAEAPACTSTEDDLPGQWKLSSQRSRKSGCSNIFSGINLHQLHRLFRIAGDRNAEHRAKLVWRGVDADVEGAEEEKEEEGGETGDEAGLAQALVGLRVRARSKAGIRVEGQRDHKWLRASGYLRFEEGISDYTVEDKEADQMPGSEKFLLPTQKDITENQTTSKLSSWRLGVARQEGGRDSEHYLHRILH
ncbi:hypothetical protein Q5P01_026298 [Channa striata]|uniref:Arginine vasopressin-induced protein 1 n=1 Tax=Channa striata TaxID=64152 RepID=A0AA88IJP3_CHASR|nr:hypothetical protein Q5P01_026298 [Channa striata]